MTILPFCSIGGGRFGQTISAIAKLAPNSVIKEGLEAAYSPYDRWEITAWLNAMHDIGILASTDPVALDQACVDLVHAAPDHASLARRMESHNGSTRWKTPRPSDLEAGTISFVDIGQQ